MRDTSKLMMAVVAGGILFGAGLSKISSPVMQFAAEADWRSRLQPTFSAMPPQFVEAGPQDLRPFGWTTGAPFVDSVDQNVVDEGIVEEVGTVPAEGAEQTSYAADETAAVLGEPRTDLAEPAPDLAPIPAAPAPTIATFGVTVPPEYSFQ